MEKRTMSMLKYECQACMRKDLASKGYACTFILPHESDSQGWCISKCPIFGDKITPEWKFISEVKKSNVETPSEKSPLKNGRKCPYVDYQGIAGMKNLQKYCKYPSSRFKCPVIELDGNDNIDCEHLNERQYKSVYYKKSGVKK